MANLCVFDVSPFFYIGMETSHKDKKCGKFYTGGLLNLNKMVTLALAEGNDVILCFDSHSMRKEWSAEYKNNRNMNHAVIAQIELAYEVLPQCGVVCLRQSGYEADDLIYQVVQDLKSKYPAVIVYGSDYDLAVNVDFNVYFRSINSLTTSVDRANFSHSIVEGEEILFNTLLPYKVFCGCTSDVVKAFTSDKGYTGHQLYSLFKDTLISSAVGYRPQQLGSKEMLLWFIELMGDELTQKDRDRLNKNIQLVYPIPIDLGEITPSNYYNVDKKLMGEFFSTIWDRDSLRNINEKKSDTALFMPQILDYTDKLYSGSLAVDNNLKFADAGTSGELLFLKGF